MTVVLPSGLEKRSVVNGSEGLAGASGERHSAVCKALGKSSVVNGEGEGRAGPVWGAPQCSVQGLGV